MHLAEERKAWLRIYSTGLKETLQVADLKLLQAELSVAKKKGESDKKADIFQRLQVHLKKVKLKLRPPGGAVRVNAEEPGDSGTGRVEEDTQPPTKGRGRGRSTGSKGRGRGRAGRGRSARIEAVEEVRTPPPDSDEPPSAKRQTPFSSPESQGPATPTAPDSEVPAATRTRSGRTVRKKTY